MSRPTHRPRPSRRPALTARLLAALALFALPSGVARAEVVLEVSGDVDVSGLPLPSAPLWVLDLTRLPLLSTVQSVLDGATYEVCSSPTPEAEPVCSLPVPIGVEVPVDIDRAVPSNILGLLALPYPDATARLNIALGDADGAADVLGLGDLDLSDTLDGVAVRFDLTRLGTDGLDGVNRPPGRVFARFHIPAVSYDAALGFASHDRLADHADVALGLKGEAIIPATEGHFETEYVMNADSGTAAPVTDHTVIVGLARVEREGLFVRTVQDPLAVTLTFTEAPTTMRGDLLAEQTPESEQLAVSYTLPDGERPGLALAAHQDFTSSGRLLPDVVSRDLGATLDRLPGAGRLAVHQTGPTVAGARRDRVDAELDTSEAVPHVTVSQLLHVVGGGVDRLDVALSGVRPLDSGGDAPCATVSALLPRRIAEGVFDPVVTADLGVPPTGTTLDAMLLGQRGTGPASQIRAHAEELPQNLRLAADVDLATREGVVAWDADAATTDLDLAIDADALDASLSLVDVPSAVDLAVDSGGLALDTDGAIGRITGWITTTGRTPAALVGIQHLLGEATLDGGPADLAVTTDLAGIGSARVRTDGCPDGTAARVCVNVATPGGGDERVALQLHGVVSSVPFTANGTLGRLPPNAFVALRDDAVDLIVDGPLSVGLLASLGDASVEHWTLPVGNGIRAEVSPDTLRAAVSLSQLPYALHLDLDAVRGIRALDDPANLFPAHVTSPWTPPLAGMRPAAVLTSVATLRQVTLDVSLLDAARALDVSVKGALDVTSAVKELRVGPIGVQAHGVDTRALEAHVARAGGGVRVDDLTVAIHRVAGQPYADVVSLGLDNLPETLELVTAVGGDEVRIPDDEQTGDGDRLSDHGLALLLRHSPDWRPAIGVRYRDDVLNEEIGAAWGTWALESTLTRVPERVWLVASGASPGDSGSGCIGIDIPSPTLEYAANASGLGLDLTLEGGLVTGNLSGTTLSAEIGSLPLRASIAVLDGANLLSITGHGDSIDDVELSVDAEIGLRLDCSGRAEAGPFSLSGYLRLEGTHGRPKATLGVGTVGLHLGSVTSLELDFGDLRKIFDLDLSFDGFPLTLDIDQFFLDFSFAAGARGCFRVEIADVGHTFCSPTFGGSVSFSTGLDVYEYTVGNKTSLVSAEVASCGVEGGIRVGRSGDGDRRDVVLVLPHLTGFDDEIRTVVAAVLAVAEGKIGVGDLFWIDGPDCD